MAGEDGLTLSAALDSLKKGAGIYRQGLAGALGPELSAFWGIQGKDDLVRVWAKVFWHIGWLANQATFKEPDDKIIALVAYNVMFRPELRTGTLKERFEKAHRAGLCPAYETARKRFGSIVEQFEFLVRAKEKDPPRPHEADLQTIIRQYKPQPVNADSRPSPLLPLPAKDPTPNNSVDPLPGSGGGPLVGPGRQPSNRSSGRKRLTKLIAGVLVGVLVLFVLAKVWHDASSDSATPSTNLPTQASTSSKPSTAPSLAAPGAGASAGLPPTPSFGSYPGQAIRATVLRVSAASSFDLAFPRSLVANAAPFMRDGPAPSDIDSYQGRLFDAGAYALGGMQVTINLEGLLGRPITVFYIQVLKTRGPIIDGSAIFIPNQGAPADRMRFWLDEPFPIPQELSNDLPVTELGPYFDQNSIMLERGKQEALSLQFIAIQASYEFRLALAFGVDGKRYSQIIDRDGGPFRIAPEVCGTQYGGMGVHLSPAAKDRLAPYKYQELVASFQEQSGLYLRRVDPKSYFKNCYK